MSLLSEVKSEQDATKQNITIFISEMKLDKTYSLQHCVKTTAAETPSEIDFTELTTLSQQTFTFPARDQQQLIIILELR